MRLFGVDLVGLTWFRSRYQVAPDGQRFVMIKFEPVKSPKEIHVVLNWFEELKTRVPNGSK